MNEDLGTIICIRTSSAQQAYFVGTGMNPIIICVPCGESSVKSTFIAKRTPERKLYNIYQNKYLHFNSFCSIDAKYRNKLTTKH